MRGVKAKQLRREAEFISGDIPNSYSHKVVKRVKIPTGRLNANGRGEAIPEFYLLEKIKTTLTECTRKTYHNLKAFYKKEL
ncbi:hypothetical protein [Caudoviricetes sp.]|nr:hypothetical protein [Caudoviricetes sp.]